MLSAPSESPATLDHSPQLDHLVVAAPTLPEGVSWLRERLGMPGLEAGPVGVHPHFGTHNHLWSLGNCYLEVIAIDPQAQPPAYPRWFGLDTLPEQPKLIHWVAQSEAAPLPIQGEYLPLERGNYRWELTVPADGSLPAGGVLPSLIRWHTPSPLLALPPSGLEFKHLTLETPHPAELTQQLGALSTQPWLSVQAGPLPRLRARISTPHGVVEL